MDANAATTLDYGGESSSSMREDDDDDIRMGARPAIGRSHGGYGDRERDRPSSGRARPRAEGAIRRVLRFFRAQSDRGYRQLRDRVPQACEEQQQQHQQQHQQNQQQRQLHAYDDVPISCMESFREMILSSWLNLLLVFVPIGMVAYLTHMNPIAVFTSNAIAVIPLSSLLTAATERVASDAGDAVGALLNISLGNLVELILFVALVNNHIRVVQASILGSILVNSLLILGTALLATGLSDNEPVYNTAETQLLSSLLFASVFVFLMPTAFGYTFDHTKVSKATLKMSRVSSLMVLLIYLLYFVHELRARPVRNTDVPSDYDIESDGNGNGIPMSMTEMQPPMIVANGHAISNMNQARTIRFADEGYETATTATTASTMTTASVRDVANKVLPVLTPFSQIEMDRFDLNAATDAATGSHEGDLALEGRGRPNDGAVYTSGRTQTFMPRSRSRTNSHTRPPSSLRSQPFQMQMQPPPPSPPLPPPSRSGHTRNMSIESLQVRPGRAASVSGVPVGMSGVAGAYTTTGSTAGVPGHAGMAGFGGLGGPGLMRSGLAALQIMRESRTSLDSNDARPVPVRRPRPAGEFMMSVIVLMVASGLMSVNAEFLVDTIDAVTHQGHLSESVIGLIILPIVGNIAEYVTVVSVAMRDKLDLAISVAIGSSIQIALCVTPLTVGAGWILNRNLSLTFSFFEMSALVGTALLVGLLVSSDGDRKLRTCGLKGALMCACYVIIG
ncbi:sodium/calcium exchanger protein [Grosmannia clavigera kw1407]|uniref:Sodium/calcium exchanger protein n=1 Tax=Grosmannia clavigera (strain kw1407 / UAMH 11150) TaxID=655863 RepID=F0XJX0_GROCL|nr:sodium/calcium exchanger protein [Grosmannia clavigera kw1407]EFX02310.1 sodium/calcium exchanger protein [Grosmannia clavigera kw1407]